MQNIGVVFVKMGQYSDAITSYEHIMTERPDYKTAFNLILCYYATGDREKMKKTFTRLLQVDLNLDDEDKYLPHPVSVGRGKGVVWGEEVYEGVGGCGCGWWKEDVW